jgi:GPH family glycoside/pentoside/hexuronide:cation symporter
MVRKSVGTWPLFAFALPAFLSALVHGPVGSIVPTLYATDFGLNLAVVGSAILVARLLDAVIDPVIGYLGDHTKSRLGRRKPWLIAGGLLTMVATYFLFSPPAKPSLAYFFVWYVAIYFAWTLTEIPHAAWGAEITRDYVDRSRVFAFRQFATYAGLVGFLLLPLLPIFPTTAVTPATLHFVAYLTLAIVPLAIGAAVIWGPAGIPAEKKSLYDLREIVSVVRGNGPLGVFLAGFLLNGLAEGMFGALTFLYFSRYLGLAQSYVFILLAVYGTSLVLMPLVPRVMARFGKHRAWGGSMLIGAVIFPLILLLPQGKAALVPLLLLSLPIGFTNAINNVAAVSLLGDIVDYDTLKTGKKRAGVFSAIYALVLKFNTAVGGAVAFLIVGLVGFHPQLGAVNDARAVLGLKVAYVIAPVAIYALSFFFVWFFPIDRRRQTIVRRRLERLEARAVAAGPLGAKRAVEVAG